MSRKRVIVAGALSLVVVAAVTVSTLLYGIISVPTFPTFASAPLEGATGRIAYSQPKEGPSNPCLFVVELPDGEPREIVCSITMSFAWLDDGRLAASSAEPYGGQENSGALVQIYDPQTGDRVGEAPLEVSDSYESTISDSSLQTDYERARIRNQDNDVLVDLGGPRDYMINSAQYSPDKQFFGISDSNGRLLISNKDGSEVRTLRDAPKPDEDEEFNSSFYFGSYGSGSAIGWYQEGRRENTVSLADLTKDGFSAATSEFTSQPFYDDF